MLYPRDVFEQIKKGLTREEFAIITGARQTGKTSLLIMLKNFLENNGTICHYFNLENPDYLKPMNRHPFNLFELIPEYKIRQYIFIDEIQYLDNPTNFLKLLYDEKRDKIKVIASGSSAFYLDKKFKDSLAGRKMLYELYTLNFNEFLVFNEEEELLKQKGQAVTIYYKNRILELWKRYLIYGGYPKVVLAETDEFRKILLEEIGTSYTKKDIVEAGIKNTDKYLSLLKVLAFQVGNLVNLQELSNTFRIAYKTIEDYIYVMEKSYQIALIRPFYRNIRKELTKMPKVYFNDPGLRNFFLHNYEDIEKRQDKGAYLENIAFRELLLQTMNKDSIKFWRTQDKKEVDFIVGNKAYEIKSKADSVKKNKYKQFTEYYPDISLNFLTYKNFIKEFYRYEFSNTRLQRTIK